ncbi:MULTISPECIES: hypothetical protein [Methanobacterium]|jgi:hypothetical protein|uniref:Uncharacterized protein n=1 Tax=Methanobacterium formicicum TaxID=2162 RepID=A0A090I7Z1_METFO|nr:MULTISPECIES: hypothetical protein [Methanobacterium]MDH2659518.1 hypothetical protein [Methanobacterium formicicum]CEA14385.1 hypothetical protein DSM1535_2062 [Methanobacterium formicicum]
MVNKKNVTFLALIIVLVLVAGIYLAVVGSGTSTNSMTKNSSCVKCGATNQSESLNETTNANHDTKNGSLTNPTCCT